MGLSGDLLLWRNMDGKELVGAFVQETLYRSVTTSSVFLPQLLSWLCTCKQGLTVRFDFCSSDLQCEQIKSLLPHYLGALMQSKGDVRAHLPLALPHDGGLVHFGRRDDGDGGAGLARSVDAQLGRALHAALRVERLVGRGLRTRKGRKEGQRVKPSLFKSLI